MSAWKQTAAAIIAGVLIDMLIPLPAGAQTVGLHIASVHSKDNDRVNNDNHGAYIQDGAWVVGGYRNSIHRNSFYFGRIVEYGPAAVTAGLITGYQKKDGQGHTRGAVGALVALSLRSPEFYGYRARVNYAPGHLVKSADVLNLAIERKF